MEFPPCVKKIVMKIKTREDITESEKIFVVKYLLDAGANEYDIKSLMSNIPDFDEKMFDIHIKQLKLDDFTISSCVKVIDFIEFNDICSPDLGCIPINNASEY